MSRSVWFVRALKKAFPLRSHLARATRIPPLGHIVDRALFDGDDMMYLPRDHAIQVHASVPGGDQMVLPSQVVEHFIEQANYHWIMHACICRDASTCKDYPIDLGCLFLGEAALGINPKLGRPVTREEARAHVRRCREAGLVHLIGRNKVDVAWLGVGPGNKLLTICNCCPCCCLWRILPHVAPQIAAKVRRMPGVTVRVTDACVGCGECTQGVCFVDAIQLRDHRAVIGDGCRGCGRCVDTCSRGAIELSLDGNQFVPEAIARTSALVDVT